MPAIFVLNGVRSPRTYASSVTCSTWPPSQAFQFRVIVTTTASARRATISGVPYFCQAGLRRESGCSTTLGTAGADDGMVAGAGEVAIMFRRSLGAVAHESASSWPFVRRANSLTSQD